MIQNKIIVFGLSLTFFFILTSCHSTEIPPAPAIDQNQLAHAVPFEQVQHILNTRCVACHSCFESPCQLNLQTWEGLRRGAFHEGAYDGLRTKAVEPQRLFEDAQTEKEWRDRGFVDVLNGGIDSILMKALRLSEIRKEISSKPVKESVICPQKPEAVLPKLVSDLAMPFGLPSLTSEQKILITTWISQGASGPPIDKTSSTEPAIQKQIQSWIDFFNAKDLKSRVTARYLYEHFFLAHLYFKESPRTFYKLIRSRTPCNQTLSPIATRRPNNDPKGEVFYCLMRDPATITFKNHLPYELSAKKMSWLKNNFLDSKWAPTHFPSYSDEVAANPLIAFEEIPVENRFKFLLEDAQYEVMTFIKGPVCSGSFAVNSIQEQFYVFFMNPRSDLMVRYSDYAKKVASQLILPGNLGSNLSFGSVASGYHKTLLHREKARHELRQQLQKAFPTGLTLEDLWDGNGTNDNAVLTVFRHDDNAKVYKGARGDTSKTVFVLDYSTFERLVYNLVINFDVFDNVSHQTLTRLYMDILRMDAEDNFLEFLPPAERLETKNKWYKGLAAQWKLDLIDEKKFALIPAGISFDMGRDSKIQLLQKIIFQRMNEKVRGPEDSLNWKTLHETRTKEPIGTQLRRLTSIAGKDKASPFPRFFPELSFLIILEKGEPRTTYSILHNREHENLSWILNENSRLAPGEDTLTILPGAAGGYPNQFFAIESGDLSKMIDRLVLIKNPKDYQSFLKEYGIHRMDPRIWNYYDFLNSDLLKHEPIEAGVLDLSRYAL